MNNKQLSFIKYEQQAAGELEYAIDFSDMDHAKFAEAAGGKGYVLKDPSRIDEVVEAALNENVPTIVDVHVDPNAAPLPGKIVNAIDFSDMDHAKFAEAAGGKGYVLKDPSRIDEVVEAALNENVPNVDVHVDPNAAPLPGKIVNEEAINYGKWATDQSLKIKIRLDEIPPISVAAKRFL